MNTGKLWTIFLTLLLIFSLAGCSAGNRTAVDSEVLYRNEGDDIYYAAEAPGDASDKTESSAELESALPENRKLIQTVRMSVEVQKLDEAITNMENRITEHGGYIQTSDIYKGSSRSRSASMTVRIPADRLSAFLETVSTISNVISSSKSVEDVTLSYVATESRLKALETEQARLLELLARAETMDDLLTIESRLTDVRTELEQVNSTLRVYDNQVDYATVHLSINEVAEYTEVPQTVGERISSGFVSTVKGLWNGLVELFIFLVVASPYWIILAVVVVVMILVVRKKKTGKNKE